MEISIWISGFRVQDGFTLDSVQKGRYLQLLPTVILIIRLHPEVQK